MTLHRLILVSLLSIIITAAPSLHSDTVGTTFTYQGVLSDAGAPVAGTYDFRLFLYNADAGGGQVGSTVLVGGVAVTDGRVTLDLDFGDVFDGTALWLEIHLRETGTTTYASLLPRQRLMATPFANHAAEADTAASALWADDAGTAASAADAFHLGGQGPAYYLAWSNITGVPGDLSNGDDDTLADLSCAAGEIAKWSGSTWACGDDFGGRSSTYVVGPVGTATENGTALLAAVASLPTASETAKILVHVEPGTYDLGTNSLPLPDWVSLEGAGRGLTTITSAVAGENATLNIGMDSELRSVTVLNTCATTGQVSYAVHTDNRSRLFNITAVSIGNASANYAVFNTGGNVVIEEAFLEVRDGAGAARRALYSTSSDLILRRSSAVVSGGSAILYAILTLGSGTFIAEDVNVSATGGSTLTFGIHSNDTEVRLTNVVIEAQTNSNAAKGFQTSASSRVVMKNVKASAFGEAGTTSYAIFLGGNFIYSEFDNVTTSSNDKGLFCYDGNGPVTIRHSQLSGANYGLTVYPNSNSHVTVHHSVLQGDSAGLIHGGGGVVTVGASQISNGTSGSSGSIICAGVWDENHIFYPSTCP